MLLHPTSKFHYLYLLSDVLVVLYIPSCAENLTAPALTLIPPEQMHHGGRTALPYR